MSKVNIIVNLIASLNITTISKKISRLIIVIMFVLVGSLLSACGGGDKKNSKVSGNNDESFKPPVEPKIANQLLKSLPKNAKAISYDHVAPTSKEEFKITESDIKISLVRYGYLEGSVFTEVPESFTDVNKDGVIKIGEEYYYNHIDGIQFTNFLPGADIPRLINLDSENNKLYKFSDIGAAQIALNSNSKATPAQVLVDYNNALLNAKGYTFKGYAFMRIANGPFRYKYEQDGGTPKGSADTALEDKMHRGTFQIDVLDIKGDKTKRDAGPQSVIIRHPADFNNNFTMKIIWDKPIEYSLTPENRSSEGVWKKAIFPVYSYSSNRTVSVVASKDINGVNAHNSKGEDKTLGFMNFYDEGGESKLGNLNIDQSRTFVAFSFDQDNKPTQMAGALRLVFYAKKSVIEGYPNSKIVLANNAAHVTYFDVVYASTEVCSTGSDGCKEFVDSAQTFE